MKLPDDLLERPAEEAVRRIALRELERAESARAALIAGEDAEALHDFRVAIRRLRSHLRAYREEMGDGVGKKLRQKLARIAGDTNPGRDAEVALAWVDELGTVEKPSEKRGVDWLRERFVRRRDEAYGAVRAEIVSEFGDLARRLAERLSRYRIELRLDDEESPARPFRAVLGGEVERHASSLAEALGQVITVADQREGHRARIEAKRLRYLLEPVAPLVEETRTAVAHLKALQDRLGDLHDLQMLAAEVAHAVAEAESERARRIADATLAGDPEGRFARAEMRRSERPGLLALARRIAARRDDVFARFESEWLGAEPTAARALDLELAALHPRLKGPGSGA